MIPHYVKDYRRLVARISAREPNLDQALRVAVGDPDDVHGHMELEVLLLAGLKPDHTVIDVGCGCGQLAVALNEFLSLDGGYLGTDVVPEFLAFAEEQSRPEFRFALVHDLTIPAPDRSADIVCLFSVLTHLHQGESFKLLREAARKLKPGGKIVATYLEFGVPEHWPHFMHLVDQTDPAHLTSYIESSTFPVWAEHLGLACQIVPSDTWVEGLGTRGRYGARAGGQSMAILTHAS